MKALKKIIETAKMKGKDPCWTGYQMVGMKDKGGKKVPNCVPEEVQQEAKDEQEYGYEGDMALNQLATLTRCAEMIKEFDFSPSLIRKFTNSILSVSYYRVNYRHVL